MLFRSKSYHQAIEQFANIPIYSDFYDNSQIHMGIILKKEGKIDEAIKIIKKAIMNKKESLVFYVFLSSLYEENKIFESSEEVLKQGLNISPRNAERLR